jgi:hypothetical protein
VRWSMPCHSRTALYHEAFIIIHASWNNVLLSVHCVLGQTRSLTGTVVEVGVRHSKEVCDSCTA